VSSFLPYFLPSFRSFFFFCLFFPYFFPSFFLPFSIYTFKNDVSREGGENEDEEEAKTIKERRKTQDLLRCQIVSLPQGVEETSSSTSSRLNKSPSFVRCFKYTYLIFRLKWWIIVLQEFQTKKLVTRQRRKTIPARLNISINLWSIMKNCIGKELTKIPMPVCTN